MKNLIKSVLLLLYVLLIGYKRFSLYAIALFWFIFPLMCLQSFPSTGFEYFVHKYAELFIIVGLAWFPAVIHLGLKFEKFVNKTLISK